MDWPLFVATVMVLGAVVVVGPVQAATETDHDAAPAPPEASRGLDESFLERLWAWARVKWVLEEDALAERQPATVARGQPGFEGSGASPSFSVLVVRGVARQPGGAATDVAADPTGLEVAWLLRPAGLLDLVIELETDLRGDVLDGAACIDAHGCSPRGTPGASGASSHDADPFTATTRSPTRATWSAGGASAGQGGSGAVPWSAHGEEAGGRLSASGSRSASRDMHAAFFGDSTTKTVLVVTGTALVLLTPLVLFGLHSRIDSSGVLETENRRRVFENIRGRPGVTIRQLAADLALHPTTVRYHVTVLANHGLVTTQARGSWLALFAVGGTQSATDRRALSLLRAPILRRVLESVAAEPGITQVQLARRLDKSEPTMAFHVDRLAEAGLVRVQAGPGGRAKRLEPAFPGVTPSGGPGVHVDEAP